MFEQLGLIGCGLMGGSFALALKRAGLVQRVVGYSKSPSTLERATQLGVIDVEAPSALLAVSGADLVLLAVPVSASESSFKAMRHLIQSDTLVMDVGSTKSDVIEAARRALGPRMDAYVPAHPITGKEKAGVDHADATLYQGRQVILTPVPETSPAQLERATLLWQRLGCLVKLMSPEAHDTTYAAVSHLPHLIAFAAMRALQGQQGAPAFMDLAGPGFRDFTRIAASEPGVWRDILIANREPVLAQAALFREALDAFEAALRDADPARLQAMIRDASEARAKWPGPPVIQDT